MLISRNIQCNTQLSSKYRADARMLPPAFTSLPSICNGSEHQTHNHSSDIWMFADFFLQNIIIHKKVDSTKMVQIMETNRIIRIILGITIKLSTRIVQIMETNRVN